MWREGIAALAILLGLAVLTIAVYGMLRMPDLYTRLHAASKAAFLGVLPFLVAAMTTGEPAMIARALLIGVFLLLTTPVAAHVIGQAAFRTDEAMETSGALDESGRGLPTDGAADDQPGGPV
jgi:multicomponent Na+:H+ antiporter subunit G